jgi:hypothetical protein
MLQEGQRTRSTRRSHVRPGRPGKPDTGGRGLDIWADRTSHGQHYADVTSLKVEAAKMNKVQPDWSAGCAERVRRVTHGRNCHQRWPEFRVHDSEATA